MYERMYNKLANAVYAAMDMIEAKEYQRALLLLEQACRDAEEIYISQ